MTAEAADVQIAANLGASLQQGLQPTRVLVSVATYRALVERDGLAPRHIGAHACDTLLAFVDGFVLVVDASAGVPNDDAHIISLGMGMGRA